MASPAATTRRKVFCVIFDFLSEPPVNVLPSFKNTIKYYNLVKNDKKEELNDNDPWHFEIFC